MIYQVIFIHPFMGEPATGRVRDLKCEIYVRIMEVSYEMLFENIRRIKSEMAGP